MATAPVLNVEQYMAKVYPSPPCWSLVADVYTTELGQPVDGYNTISSSVRAVASAFRLALHKTPQGFGRIDGPVEFAVVLMGKTQRLGLHHCGIFYGGRVLHALDSGTLFQDLATLQAEYQLMEFWSR